MFSNPAVSVEIALFVPGDRDPCSSLNCPSFSKCVASFDGSSASCQCPQHCNLEDKGPHTVVCGEILEQCGSEAEGISFFTTECGAINQG